MGRLDLLLKYVQPRRAHIKGPYICVHKKGTVSSGVGETKEVPDIIAHFILEKDGDIVQKVDKKPKKKKATKVPANKMVPADTIKDK